MDDLSRMTFGYLIEHKDQTFDRFKDFNALVENQIDLKIKMLRSINGGEYNNNEFNDYHTKYNIKRQFTIPYTPQQNSVIERKNMIIMDISRCMLGNLPCFLWGEAVSTVIYTLNRYLPKIIEGIFIIFFKTKTFPIFIIFNIYIFKSTL